LLVVPLALDRVDLERAVVVVDAEAGAAGRSEHQHRAAADEVDVEQLQEHLIRVGQERRPRKVARALVRRRELLDMRDRHSWSSSIWRSKYIAAASQLAGGCVPVASSAAAVR